MGDKSPKAKERAKKQDMRAKEQKKHAVDARTPQASPPPAPKSLPG